MDEQNPGLLWRGIRKVRHLYLRHVLRNLWRLRGGRAVRVFGEDCRFSPDSSIFEYRHVEVPGEPLLKDIVSYTDYVQLRALVREAELLKDGPVAVEVGAFHGVYVVILGNIIKKKGGKLIAVEPHPRQFDELMQNVRLNALEETVVCEKLAVADYEGKAHLAFAGNQSVLGESQGKEGVETRVATIRTLMDQHALKTIDLLIIDVEGAELPVLRGLPWDSMGRPKIFCEMHPFAWKHFEYTGEDVGRFIRGKGYRCFDMYFQEHHDFPESLFYIGPTLLFPR